MKRTIRRWVYGVRLAAYFAIQSPQGPKYPLREYARYFDRREHNTKEAPHAH